MNIGSQLWGTQVRCTIIDSVVSALPYYFEVNNTGRVLAVSRSYQAKHDLVWVSAKTKALFLMSKHHICLVLSNEHGKLFINKILTQNIDVKKLDHNSG